MHALSLRWFLAPVVVVAGCGGEPLTRTAPRFSQPPPAPPAGPRVIDGRADVLTPWPGAPALLGPPYPVILVHGFTGWSDIGPLGYFFEVERALADAGVDVTAPALPPYAPSDDRARVLADVVDHTIARTGRAKVHLIAHSQGGMDARRLVGGLGYADRVASVSTISTPYLGTEVAALGALAPDGVVNPAGQFLAWLLGMGDGEPPSEAAWATDDSSDAWTPELAAALQALTPPASEQLLLDNPWPEEVPLFMLAGVSNLRSLDNDACAGGLWPRADRVDDVDLLFLASGSYLSNTGGGTLLSPTPNDGLVTVASARAGGGTFLGCIPADHADEIGQVADLLPSLVSGFDHRALYQDLVALARSVE